MCRVLGQLRPGREAPTRLAEIASEISSEIASIYCFLTCWHWRLSLVSTPVVGLVPLADLRPHRYLHQRAALTPRVSSSRARSRSLARTTGPSWTPLWRTRALRFALPLLSLPLLSLPLLSLPLLSLPLLPRQNRCSLFPVSLTCTLSPRAFPHSQRTA